MPFNLETQLVLVPSNILFLFRTRLLKKFLIPNSNIKKYKMYTHRTQKNAIRSNHQMKHSRLKLEKKLQKIPRGLKNSQKYLVYFKFFNLKLSTAYIWKFFINSNFCNIFEIYTQCRSHSTMAR